MERTERINKLKRFLQENHANVQAFNTRNIAGDRMETVYKDGDIIVDYCKGWEYIEIFGLTEEEFDDLLDPESSFSDNLKTFEEWVN